MGSSSRSLDTPRSKPGTRSAQRANGGGVSDGRGSSRSLPGGYPARRASGRDLTPRALYPRGRAAPTSPTKQPPAAIADGSSVGSGGGAGQGDGSRRRGRCEAGFRPVDGVASPRDSPRPPRHAGGATPGSHSRGVRPPTVPQSSPQHRHGAAPPSAPSSAPLPGRHAARTSRAGPLVRWQVVHVGSRVICPHHGAAPLLPLPTRFTHAVRWLPSRSSIRRLRRQAILWRPTAMHPPPTRRSCCP